MAEYQRSIEIEAEPEVVFRLIAEPEFWPAYIPTCRYLLVTSRGTDSRLIRLRVAGWPCWPTLTALHTADRDSLVITLAHLSGPGTGCSTIWRTLATASGCRLEARHDLSGWVSSRPGSLRRWLARRALGRYAGQAFLEAFRGVAEGSGFGERR